MTAAAMLTELAQLEGDLGMLNDALQRLLPSLVRDARLTAASEIVVIGHGDSHAAGLAAWMAFASPGGPAFRALHAQHFLDYGIGQMALPGYSLVIGVSASGTTERTVAALEAARSAGATTLAITGDPASRLASAADRTISVALTDKQPGPGMRSFQASLAALLALAIILQPADDPWPALERLPRMVGATVRAAIDKAGPAARLIAGAPYVSFAGSGPGQGCARFAAAKLIEAAGWPAGAQELEEWWHVERFQIPTSLPLVVIVQPGRSHPRAKALMAQARKHGNRIVAVASARDAASLSLADVVLPVIGEAPEALSPLLYTPFAGAVGAALAELTGRAPFGALPGRTQPR
jgi:glucosamine--fructose-6-phosphate aminotransferase (isomerizing)